MYILHFAASTMVTALFSSTSISADTSMTAFITSDSLPTPDGSMMMRSGLYCVRTSARDVPKSPTREQQCIIIPLHFYKSAFSDFAKRKRSWNKISCFFQPNSKALLFYTQPYAHLSLSMSGCIPPGHTPAGHLISAGTSTMACCSGSVFKITRELRTTSSGWMATLVRPLSFHPVPEQGKGHIPPKSSGLVVQGSQVQVRISWNPANYCSQ